MAADCELGALRFLGVICRGTRQVTSKNRLSRIQILGDTFDASGGIT
jgi:hypothetical protein